MNYVLQEYKKTSTYDILGNKRLVKRLRIECRLAKESLSFDAPSYNIHVSIIKIIEVANYKIHYFDYFFNNANMNIIRRSIEGECLFCQSALGP